MQVDPAEAWLQDDCDSNAYFPQEGGHFNLDTLGLSYATLTVEGPDAVVGRGSNLPPPRPSSVTVASTQSSASLPPPVFRSVTAPRQGSTFSFKVVKATLQRKGRGKPEFQASSQTYIELAEATANLDHILMTIRKRWGGEYTLVTTDGIELEDSPATQGGTYCLAVSFAIIPSKNVSTGIVSSQLTLLFLVSIASLGLAFWKCPRRKLYAVPASDVTGSICKKRPIVLDSDDDDFEQSSSSKKRSRTERKLEMLLDDVGTVKEALTDIMSLTRDSRMPLGLKQILRDNFQCFICHVVPIRPPVIITKCCKTILGCETCVNAWYSGEDALTKTCPKCRAERGYETMLLRGLDDFLKQIQKAIQTEDERDDEDVPPVCVD